ncbi:MAG: hemolysin family protein [Anaerolineae bacterium]
MADPFIQILIILGLVILNGILAMSEIAVVSSRKARLRQAADTGDERARAALDLATDPTQFLATVQIGITLVGILAGAFGEATLARALGEQLQKIPALVPYAEAISTVIVVLGVTYVSLVIGELVPKRLGLNSSERIASVIAAPMRVLSRIAQPIVWLLSVSTDGVLQLLGIEPSQIPEITPGEIEVLVEQGTEIGIFEASEQDMIESVLRLDERRVDAFMTPRTQIRWIDLEDPEEEIRQMLLEAKHSRFPVMEDEPDNVLGILYTKDLVVRQLRGEPFDVRACLRPVLFVPESMSTLRVLELFKQEGNHIALVTDEYGSIQGMVTDMDILEAIVGDIPAEGEPEEPHAIPREDGSWLVDGMLRVDRLWEYLGLEHEMDDVYRGYQTVAGFMMAELDVVPTEGEYFDFHGLRFEVVDMDGRRVDKVLVHPAQEETNAPPPRQTRGGTEGSEQTTNGSPT